MTDIIKNFEKFFFDFIGLVIPGALLIIGGWSLVATDLNKLPAYDLLSNDVYWVFFFMLSYILGHAVTSLFHMKWFSILLNFLDKVSPKKFVIPATIKSREKIEQEILTHNSFIQFRQVYNSRDSKEVDNLANDLHYWRNIAITNIPDHERKIHKFMFISMLNFGIASDLLIFLFCYILFFIIAKLVPTFHHNTWSLISIVSMGLLVIPFLERGASFYNRSMSLPFSIARDILKEKKTVIENRVIETLSRKVYLAGGFHSGWQDKVITGIPGFMYLDPRIHNFGSPKQYTEWDLNAIKQADIVFAYFEETNPAGYALALELGFAKALNIPIIFIDEKSKKDVSLSRKLGMLQASASVVFDDFEEGYNHLLQLSRI